jgi:hypothetical protein
VSTRKKVLSLGAAVALGQPDGCEAPGPGTRAASARLLHETLDDQHGMMPARRPVVAEAAQGRTEHPGGEVGIALAWGQDQEAAVLDNPTEAAGPRARGPAEPMFAALEMEGGGAEREQGDPLAVEFGDVAEGLAGQAGAGQIVLFFQGAVEGRAFVVADEAEGTRFKTSRSLNGGGVGLAALSNGRRRRFSHFASMGRLPLDGRSK